MRRTSAHPVAPPPLAPPPLAPRRATSRTGARWAALLAIASLGGFAVGCFGPGGDAAKPPIVLISIDTLRSDHLPAYGYRDGATPAIDRLVQDGILFQEAYSPIPLTLPAHQSIFTGLLPNRHGVRDNIGYPVHTADLPYLPRLLKGRGYTTGGAISAYPISRKTGFGADFDFYEDSKEYQLEKGVAGLERPGAETLEKGLPWLRQAAAGSQPFFFFLHLYEPHYPYHPPPAFAGRFAKAYDGEIAEADRLVGLVIRELESLGIYEETTIVLLSDHGEGLMDHGEQEHGVLLYREALQVPLILKLPQQRQAGTRVTAAPAQLVDVMPTLLELAGIERPGDLDGKSLLGLIAGKNLEAFDRPIYAETYYPRIHLGWSELFSVIRQGFHYIEAPEPELYDLARDPAEKNDVRETERRKLGELRQDMRLYEAHFGAPGQIDAESQKALASLGYLTGPVATGKGPLLDPKRRVHIYESLKQGNEAFDAGDFVKAAELYRRTVDEDPTIARAWGDLGRSLRQLGRLEEALVAYREALARHDDPIELAREAMNLSKQLGRPQVALELAGDLIARHPADVRTYFLRIRVLMAERRFDEALADSEKAVRLAPTHPDSLYARGTVWMAKGALDAAEKDLRQALTHDPRYVPALSDLALIVGHRGDLLEAKRLLEQVLAIQPNDENARRNLLALERQLAAGR